METIQIEGLTSNQLQELFKDLSNGIEHKIEGLRKDLQSLIKPQPQNNGKEYLTTKEACEFLNVSSMTLRRWSHAGILTPKRVGNKVYYSRANIEAALQDKAV